MILRSPPPVRLNVKENKESDYEPYFEEEITVFEILITYVSFLHAAITIVLQSLSANIVI